jgi:pilus assembly protein CpaD
VASAVDRHRIDVEQTAVRLEIEVSASDLALSSKSRADLNAFASGYLRYGHGALILSTPDGGGNAGAVARLSEQTRMSLEEAGVSYAAVAGSSYDGAGEASPPIVVSFARFEAHAPECAPLWEQDLAHQSDNQPWESFGCATQANLAAMVEDPQDLLHARAEDPRDSNRRAAVFEAYRQGDQTHADRSEDERITISTVAQ